MARHTHQYTIADDEAVKVLLDKASHVHVDGAFKRLAQGGDAHCSRQAQRENGRFGMPKITFFSQRPGLTSKLYVDDTVQKKNGVNYRSRLSCSKLSYSRAEILEPLLELALEIAREGREGRRIGTMFTVGDAEAVMAWSRLLILNPLQGHPKNLRQITSTIPQMGGG